MRFSRLTALVFALFAGFAAPQAQAFDATQANYIQSQFLPPDLLPPPPAEGSKEWAAQAAAVEQAQKNLSLATIAAIRDEQKMRVEVMTGMMGPAFTRARLPKTFMLLDCVLNSAGQVVEADKKFWHTRRPYLADPKVKLYVDAIDSSPSYPSGHTAESRVLAEVLGMLMPDQLAALRARADVVARHRIQAGVHYPVDVEQGRMLSMLIVGALTENDDFQSDLAAAKKELGAK